MRYQGNYRLMDNPRAKQSHRYRALLKRQEREAVRRQRDHHNEKRCGHAR